MMGARECVAVLIACTSALAWQPAAAVPATHCSLRSRCITLNDRLTPEQQKAQKEKIQAMLDAEHPMVPIAGESENGYRKLVAKYADKGLKGISIGQSPGLVAISMKAAISALEGNVMPQLISVPLPVADYTELKDGVNYWTDLPDNFFTVNEFPPCGVNISGPAIMSQSEADVK